MSILNMKKPLGMKKNIPVFLASGNVDGMAS